MKTFVMIVHTGSRENSYHDRDFVPAKGIVRWLLLVELVFIFSKNGENIEEKFCNVEKKIQRIGR